MTASKSLQAGQCRPRDRLANRSRRANAPLAGAITCTYIPIRHVYTTEDSMMSGTHENFAPGTRRRGPSDRSFGLVLAVAFLLPGLLAWRHGGPARFGYFAVGAFLDTPSG